MNLGSPTESILSSLSDGVFVTDANGRITWTNPAFSTLSGWSRTEAAGQQPESFLCGPDTDPEIAASVGVAFEKTRPFETELVAYHRNGHAYWAHLTIRPVRNKSGTVEGFIGIEQDRSVDRKYTGDLENEITRLYQLLLDVAPVGEINQ